MVADVKRRSAQRAITLLSCSRRLSRKIQRQLTTWTGRVPPAEEGTVNVSSFQASRVCHSGSRLWEHNSRIAAPTITIGPPPVPSSSPAAKQGLISQEVISQEMMPACVPLDPDTAALQRQVNEWDRIKRETAWGRT